MFSFRFMIFNWASLRLRKCCPIDMKAHLVFYSQYILSLSCLHMLQSKNIQIKTYRPIIWPVVLYWCENWSLTLREELRLRVFENTVLRRIFGPKREEVTGERKKTISWGAWRYVLLIKYYLSDQIEKNGMDGTYSTYGGEERCIQGFGRDTRGKETTWKTQA